MKYLAILVIIYTWVAGVVIAKGFISTSAAVFFPFWAWYLVVEKLIQHL